MEIKNFVLGPLQTNSYLIYENGKAVLIDCGGEVDILLNFLEKNNLKLEKVYLTHGHFDHIDNLDKLKEKTGCLVGIHKKDSFMLNHSFNLQYIDSTVSKEDFNFQEGEVLEFNLKVIETPGHTPGGCSFYIESKKLLFSGDTLFRKGVGRTDLPKSNHSDLIKSLKKLVKLPENVRVYPGHGGDTLIKNEKKYFV